MRTRICLALPTNRVCTDTIAALHAEAAYAAAHFEVEVHVLILDSSDARTHAAHRAVVDTLGPVPHVGVHLFDETAQRVLLERAIQQINRQLRTRRIIAEGWALHK